MIQSIVICGVGGQGTLLASRIIGKAALLENYDVKMSEVHGMAQRGGSVITYVRYGDKVVSPIIPLGQADALIAFEQLEGLRWVKYLKKEGIYISNTQKIDPMPVITGQAEYPEDIDKLLSSKLDNCTFIDAYEMAISAGSKKAVNTVLIGVLAKTSDIPKDVWLQAVKESVPSKFVEQNVAAFEAGYSVR